MTGNCVVLKEVKKISSHAHKTKSFLFLFNFIRLNYHKITNMQKQTNKTKQNK